jgi:hypothetical protein
MMKVLVVPVAALAFASPGGSAQLGSALAMTVPYPVAQVPFGPGEVMRYDVKWGIFGSVGDGRLEVAKIDTINGHPAYQLHFAVKGGLPLAKVNDLSQSWLDVSNLYSHRYDQNTHEVNYKRHRIIDFFPDEMKWVRQNSDDQGELASAEPLDDVSFLYYVRTLPLIVGDVYTFDRYWKEDGNPVVVKVLRKDSIKIGPDTYNTIVVQPIIKTKGIFSEGGEAEVHFSDDPRRLIVHLRAKMSIGTLRMYLQSYTPGTQLVSSQTANGTEH